MPGMEGPQELAGAAARFRIEVLASFEMAQRAFQANSKIISSSDDMLQELVNLKR